MANSLNRVTLVGNLGSDPEVRVIPNGAKVASFNVATTESYKDKVSGDWKDTTEWHRLTMWDYNAERAEKYLKKGDKIYVEGKLKTKSYEDKDKVTRYVTEIQVQNFIQMGGKSGSDGGNQGGGYNAAPSPLPKDDFSSDEEFSDDIPF